MGMFGFFLKAIAFSAFISIQNVNGQGYMDFSCHPEFVQDNSENFGRGLTEDIEAQCVGHLDSYTESCYQRCVLEDLGIIQENGGNIFYPENTMANRLHRLFSMPKNEAGEFEPVTPTAIDCHPIAKKIAGDIIDNCSTIAEETKDLPCEDQTHFYDCVEQATGCSRK